MSESCWETEVEVQIPFHDVDAMQVTWHGHYAKYFELARCDLLRKIDYDYPQMKESGYAWPVIDLHIRYIKPTLFGQWISIQANILEWENRLKIKYQIFDKDNRERLTKGHSIQVAFDIRKQEMLLVSPNVLLKKLGVQDS